MTEMCPPPVIVNFTPTGAVPTRARHPGVPMSAEEITMQVTAAVGLGISMVHLHVRDVADAPTLDPSAYARTIGLIRESHPDLVICISLSGRHGESLEERLAPLALEGDLKPDMASLTLSSLNFSRSASINAPATIEALAGRMLERGILPELEIFDAGMASMARYLVRKGLLCGPHYANIILGNLASAQVDPLSIGFLLRELPDDTLWSLGGIGEAQLPANAIALAAGGGVRVGLEDNLHWDAARSRLATNQELLSRTLQLASIHERPVMTPGELRQRLRLRPGQGQYGRARAV